MVAIGNHWWPLVTISIIYVNGSVAIGHSWYWSVPMATSVGSQWEKSEHTLRYLSYLVVNTILSYTCIYKYIAQKESLSMKRKKEMDVYTLTNNI